MSWKLLLPLLKEAYEGKTFLKCTLKKLSRVLATIGKIIGLVPNFKMWEGVMENFRYI